MFFAWAFIFALLCRSGQALKHFDGMIVRTFTLLCPDSCEIQPVTGFPSCLWSVSSAGMRRDISVCIKMVYARGRFRAIKTERREEILLSRIARRKFIQLSAVAAAGCLVRPASEAQAQDLPKLTEDHVLAQGMKYTHDASTVDSASRPNLAPDQICANCALIQGDEAAEWRPCQIFQGYLVNNKGWCMVWAPKA